MFSSNQILQVSGTFSQLLEALKFALALEGVSDTDHMAYQITEDGRYCIGRLYNKPVEGWTEFTMNGTPDFNIVSVSNIIMNFLANQPHEPYDQDDGGYLKTGFLMKAIPESVNQTEYNGIKNPSYGIVEFSQFACFYSL